MLLAAALVAAPAAVLRGLCAGRSCERAARAAAETPFCSLPDATRRLVAAGFRTGRSADVVGVTATELVAGSVPRAAGDPGAPWPVASDAATRVPVVFWGEGVARGRLPAGFGLDDVAPTVAEIIGLERPHPEVRSGRAAPGVATGSPPRLVLEVVWEGTGAAQLRNPSALPTLASLVRRGAATSSAEVGSLPLDPAAVLTTIGTGGLPHQHGVTGSLVRNDRGDVVRPFGADAPPYVIATLADDLDHSGRGGPRIGVVARRGYARGLVGGTWYLDGDRDDLRFGRADVVTRARSLLRRGYGDDRAVDVLAIVDEGPARELDARLAELVDLAQRAARGSLAVAVTATGSAAERRSSLAARYVVERIEAQLAPGVIDAAVPGGLFTDEDELATRSLSNDAVVGAARELTAPSGGRLFRDAFPALAVSFARYC